MDLYTPVLSPASLPTTSARQHNLVIVRGVLLIPDTAGKRMYLASEQNHQPHYRDALNLNITNSENDSRTIEVKIVIFQHFPGFPKS